VATPRTALIGLLKAAHPEPGAAVTVGATMLAAIAGQGIGGTVAVAVTIAASQFATGWHNDWLDADRDRAAGRTDKPIPAGAISRRAVGLAAAISALVTLPLALLSGWPAAVAATVGLAASLTYNAVLKFTAFSVLPYVVAFAALPAFVVLGLPGAPAPPWWLLAAGATLGGGAHFANVLPDFEHDARTGVRGLPHRLGELGSVLAAAGLLIAASALLVLGPPGPPTTVGLLGLGAASVILLIGGYWQRRAPGSRAAFRTVIIAALIDVALLLTAGAVV
jgi:4-hydroxybenzoate polyprenyltransferase